MAVVKHLKTCIVLGLLMIISVWAFANTYTVTTTSDFPISGAGISVNSATGVITGGAGNGFVTLRSAIAAANTIAGPHTINLAASTYTLTIPGTGESAFPADITKGDLDVTRNDVSVQGAGYASTTINQTSGIDRVFDVNVDYIFGVQFHFTIDGVTVSGGRDQSGNGGGMFCGSNATGGLTTVNNCRFLNNQTTNPGNGGGAIDHIGGNLTVTNCIFGGTNPTDFNQASTSGGAIYFDASGTIATFTCTNNVFTNNIANSGSAGGGAIDVAANFGVGTVNITSCTFTGNHANTAGGGAIMNESVTLNVTKCTFLNNTADHGGAVSEGGLGTTVSFSRLFGNLATTAGNGFDGTVALNGDNNWWGFNSGPPAGSLSGSATAARWLQLKNTGSPTTICNSGGISTITASFLSNNLSEPIAAANLSALVGQLITFNAPVNGTLSGAQSSIQAAGTATATFTATTAGSGSANAVFVPITENFTVTTSPTITVKANNTISFNSGAVNQTKTAGTAITTTTWNTTNATGATFASLPPGVTGNWAANVATISGTVTTVGTYNYTITLTGGCNGGSTGGQIIVSPPLPVNLVSFTGKLNSDKTVTLQWKVEEQQDILQYIVEESSNAVVFRPLGSVPAGNGAVATYSLIDRLVATGDNYYRLKIIELSGKITYSNIVLVNLKAVITVMLYPNPVTGQLTIQQFGSIQNKIAVLSDGQGKTLQQIRLTRLQQEVNLETYPAGVYIVKMEDGTVIKVIKR